MFKIFENFIKLIVDDKFTFDTSVTKQYQSFMKWEACENRNEKTTITQHVFNLERNCCIKKKKIYFFLHKVWKFIQPMMMKFSFSFRVFFSLFIIVAAVVVTFPAMII